MSISISPFFRHDIHDLPQINKKLREEVYKMGLEVFRTRRVCKPRKRPSHEEMDRNMHQLLIRRQQLGRSSCRMSCSASVEVSSIYGESGFILHFYLFHPLDLLGHQRASHILELMQTPRGSSRCQFWISQPPSLFQATNTLED